MKTKALSIGVSIYAATLLGCSKGFTAKEFSSASPSTITSTMNSVGATLYTQNCAGCHGTLASSAKRGRLASDIQQAIGGVTSMRALVSLSAAQVSAIADALRVTPIQPQACTDGQKLLAPQLKRLTGMQFANSLKNAFGEIFQDSQFPNFNDSNPRLGLASDPAHLAIDEININALYDSVQILVDTIRTQNSTVAACVTGTSTTCFANIMSSSGLKLWRRPLTSQETSDFNAGLTSITNAGGTRANRVDFILKGLLLAPHHLYRSELGASLTAPTQIFALTQYEIASLLSFTVWDYPPDDILLEQARLNSLSDKTALKAQFARMALDPRFKRKMASFTIDVLKIEDVKTVTKDASFGLTTADRGALYTSARLTLEDGYTQPSADFMAPFRTEKFQINDLSARYFGAPATGLTANFTAYNSNPTQRYGILSHPAFLTSISGEIASGIVRRGVFTLEQLLCNHIGAPPPGVMGVTSLPAGWDPTKVSSREVLRVTHSAQTSCMGCHSKIDPAGFGFENFGPFGQYRTVEKGAIAIDASGTIAGASAQPLVFANSVGYLHALADSETLRQCMNKQFFKYASGESHETVSGQCEYANLETKLAQKGGSVQALMESYLELESFGKRKPEAP